ncbi:MAG: rRNA maturation RNase YbeY [Pseudomonadales bacterium]
MGLEVQMACALPDMPTQAEIADWVRAVCDRFDTTGADLCIRVVEAAESRELNHRYRGKDAPTNVLSFAGDLTLPESPVLGDLLLCAPVIQQEAAAQDKSVHDHFAHLVVHGLLHLHGYDHQDEEEAHAMETLEMEMLAAFGISNPYR